MTFINNAAKMYFIYLNGINSTNRIQFECAHFTGRVIPKWKALFVCVWACDGNYVDFLLNLVDFRDGEILIRTEKKNKQTNKTERIQFTFQFYCHQLRKELNIALKAKWKIMATTTAAEATIHTKLCMQFLSLIFHS